VSPGYEDLVKATDVEKRASLKKKISENKTFPIIGAFDPICAKLVEKHGLSCTYVSGSATAATGFGLPDLGIVSLQETAFVAGNIAHAVTIPTLADADTGFGPLAEIPKTIELFEAQGLAGIHLEDQVFPKRCGHLDGKEVISEKDMVEKIKKAIQSRKDPNFLIIARVDSYSVNGFDDMLHRAQAYAEAGADMIFPEAMTTHQDYETTCKTLTCPVLVNMTEFGKTPYTTLKQFSDMGARAVLYPLSVYRSVLGDANRAIQSILEHGNQEKLLDSMMNRQDFYDLIDYQAYEKVLSEKTYSP
jgi:methylisocitrate lyase